MEAKYICIVQFDDSLNANVLVQKIIKSDGEELRKNWRAALAKGTSLDEPLHTLWGDKPWSDFPSERDYILAKWAEAV
jgi:hypothetical protein